MFTQLTLQICIYIKLTRTADRKPAEFNFQVLRLVLTCGLNLQKWGKSDNGFFAKFAMLPMIFPICCFLYKGYHSLEFDWSYI